MNVVLLFAFGRYLWNASPALASSLAAYFNFAALFVIFRGRYGSLGATAIFSSLGKMAVCGAAMAGACVVALRYAHFETIEHFGSRAAMLAVLIAICVGVYFALAKLLKCEELPELFLLLQRAEPEAVTLGVDV